MSHVVVSPTHGNLFYQRLAGRIATALGELDVAARVVESDEIETVDVATRTWVVNPSECALSEGFALRLRQLERPVAVVAESVETRWYAAQFDIDAAWARWIDIGFASQERSAGAKAGYRFVFNGPTAEERASLMQVSANGGPIPWLVVGHRTDERVALVAKLEEHAAGGVAFLPRSKRVRLGGGTLDPASVDELLRRSRYYVWCSHHAFSYYESFRFVDAVLAGAAPCKIALTSEGAGDVPLVFGDVGRVFEEADAAGDDALFERARRWYLDQPSLAEGLSTAIGEGL